MANRRMFSLDVVDTDAFLDLPISSQALYFHLGMRADDDGFVSSPRRLTAMIGANQDDLKLLAAKGFVITLESGIVVIRHWKQNNYIQKDRYKCTIYNQELACLSVENGIYRVCVSNMDTSCIQNGDIGKDREVKIKVSESAFCAEPDKPPSAPPVISLPLNDKTLHDISQYDLDCWKELYPAVDVLQELRKMKGWIDSNPTRRKTRRGIRRFINSWLAREQDKHHRIGSPDKNGLEEFLNE